MASKKLTVPVALRSTTRDTTAGYRGRGAGLPKHQLRALFHVGDDEGYSDEEMVFLQAVQKYKTEHNRPFPTWSEILALAKCLGYRKVASEVTVGEPLPS